MKARTKKRRFRLIPFLVLLVLIAAAAYYFLSLPIWKIQEVVVNGTKILVPEEVKALAGVPLSENLFFTSLARSRNNLKRIPAIRDFRFYRIPPGTILISLSERKPVATIVFPDRSVIIDREGYILNLNAGLTLNLPDRADLPVVAGIGEKEFVKEGRIDQEAARVVEQILSKLSRFLESRKTYLELGSLENVEFLLDDLLRVKLGDSRQLERKMEVFGALVPVVSGKWEKVEYIDVRFPDNPVIKYK